MSAIGPISSIASGISIPAAAQPIQGGKEAGFGDALKTAMNNVDGDQQASSEAINDLLTGKTQDVLSVVSAVAKADMSFKLLLGVRNKVIDAYKQTMNMQI